MINIENIEKDLDDLDETLKRKFFIIKDNIEEKGIDFYREHITRNSQEFSLTIFPLLIKFHYSTNIDIIVDKIKHISICK